MTLEIFLIGILAVSVLTGLFTEGIKKTLEDLGRECKAKNLLAGSVAAVLALLISAGYLILTETVLNEKMAVYLIALILLSWLCAMVGYDKVIQAICQITGAKGE